MCEGVCVVCVMCEGVCVVCVMCEGVCVVCVNVCETVWGYIPVLLKPKNFSNLAHASVFFYTISVIEVVRIEQQDAMTQIQLSCKPSNNTHPTTAQLDGVLAAMSVLPFLDKAAFVMLKAVPAYRWMDQDSKHHACFRYLTTHNRRAHCILIIL